jgi:hypothetical protein
MQSFHDVHKQKEYGAYHVCPSGHPSVLKPKARWLDFDEILYKLAFPEL